MSRRVFTLNEALAELLRDDEDDFLNGEGNVNEGSDSDESEDLEKNDSTLSVSTESAGDASRQSGSSDVLLSGDFHRSS